MTPPEILPIPSPSVVHNPGRLFKEFPPHPRVLVIYLDSAHPAHPAGDRPPPHLLAPSAASQGPFLISSTAGLALLQMAPDGSAGHCTLSGDPGISLLGAQPAPCYSMDPSQSCPSFPTGEATGDF